MGVQAARHPLRPVLPMLMTLAIVLLIVWALCVLAFKVTVGIIHLLIVLAVIAFVMHFLRGRNRVT